MDACRLNVRVRAALATLAVSTAVLFGDMRSASGAIQTVPAATPAPSVACDVEPLLPETWAEIVVGPPGIAVSTLRGTPIATPTPPAEGVPAAPDVVEAVSETIERFGACLNAGDQARAFALFSDEYLAAFFGGIAGPDLTAEEAARQIEQSPPPTPLPPEMRVPVPSIEDVRVLPDGRVKTTIRTAVGRSLAVFVERDGRYLIDWTYELPGAGTPTP